MRYIVVFLVLVTLVYGATPKLTCSVSDFANVAYSTNDPKERKEITEKWLDIYGKSCSKDQLTAIYNGLAMSLGTSDNMSIRTKIEILYERLN